MTIYLIITSTIVLLSRTTVNLYLFPELNTIAIGSARSKSRMGLKLEMETIPNYNYYYIIILQLYLLNLLSTGNGIGKLKCVSSQLIVN